MPSTGTYSIEAYGAMGNGCGTPGSGAIIYGEFQLQAGAQLKILVGQTGIRYGSCSGGGGGGSFIAYADNTPLLVAGGGSGVQQLVRRSWPVRK